MLFVLALASCISDQDVEDRVCAGTPTEIRDIHRRCLSGEWDAKTCEAIDCDGDHVSLAEDCDDSNLDVSPAASEICGNLTDEDCDGATNNACAS